MANNRLKYLDAMRGIAVLMVLMVHSTELSDISKFKPMLRHFIESGVLGVQLFFIISAYTLFYTLKKNKKSGSNFYLRRFFRIAPTYYLAVIIYCIYNQYLGEGTLINLLFWHGFSPKYINSIVPGGWSIGIEVLFYLLIPLLFKYITDLPKAIYFLFITLLIKIFVNYVIQIPIFSEVAADGSFMYFWLPNQLPVFAIGFILFFYLDKEENNINPPFQPILTLVALIIFSIMTSLSIFGSHIIAAAAFAVILAFFGSNKGYPLLENKFLLFIGKISYSAYLWQYAMIFLLKKIELYNFIQGNGYVNFIFNFLILFTLTTITAFISFLLIEKPSQKIGLKIADRYFHTKHKTINA